MTFETIDRCDPDVVIRRVDCRACNLRCEVKMARHCVQRDRDDEEPEFADSKSAAWMTFDALMGGPERRARRREVERFIAHVDERLRDEMRRGGCEHAGREKGGDDGG